MSYPWQSKMTLVPVMVIPLVVPSQIKLASRIKYLLSEPGPVVGGIVASQLSITAPGSVSQLVFGVSQPSSLLPFRLPVMLAPPAVQAEGAVAMERATMRVRLENNMMQTMVVCFFVCRFVVMQYEFVRADCARRTFLSIWVVVAKARSPVFAIDTMIIGDKDAIAQNLFQ
jgi:hypothetical protein